MHQWKPSDNLYPVVSRILHHHRYHLQSLNLRLCVFVFYWFYVAIFSVFLAADVRAFVPFCPAQFNVAHCLHLYMIIFELINEDDDDDDDDELRDHTAWRKAKDRDV